MKRKRENFGRHSRKEQQQQQQKEELPEDWKEREDLVIN